MAERPSFLAATLAELSRRRVTRTVGGYAVVAFVLLQLMDAAVEPLRLPDWLPTLLVICLILGFPLVFILAWHFDLTTHGISRTRVASRLSRSQSALLFGLMLLATAGIGYGLFRYYSGVFEGAPGQPAEARAFSAPENSIAVMPFVDLSAEGDQAYLSDGIAEEILNLLAQVEGLHVAARTSAFAFRDGQRDIREIGRLLNVRTVLEGSVRTSGNRVRLTAQLINVEDGFHIWSQSYDREMGDLFALQDEIASSIAGALVDSFVGLEAKPAQKTDSIAAANAYRTGRLLWWRRTPADLEQALVFFGEALEHDAAYAPAYAAMADTWLLLSMYGNYSLIEAATKAEPMIDKALAIDPESAEAFAALGLARWQIGQPDAAESALRRATELNEDYVPAQIWLAGIIGSQGRYAEEHEVLVHAMKRDPLNELLVVNHSHNLAMRGEAEAGRQSLQDLVAVRPDSTMLLRALAEQELSQGRLVEGWRTAQRSWQLQPESPADLSVMAKAWLTLNRPDEAEKLLEAGLEKSGNNTNLLNTQWLTLLISGRYEKAQGIVRTLQGRGGEELPPALQRELNLAQGLLAMAQGRLADAEQYLVNASSGVSAASESHNQVLALSMAAVVAERRGDAGTANERLEAAERIVQLERLNGVQNAEIHYTEAALLSMRGNYPAAEQKLEEAYARGFRELWLMKLDWRLDAIRERGTFGRVQAQIEQDIERALAEIEALQVAAAW